MNKIILRFCIAKNNEVLEVVFDTRLSFIDNFKLLKDVYAVGEEFYIFDNDKMIALRKDIPLSSFNFHNFVSLSIY